MPTSCACRKSRKRSKSVACCWIWKRKRSRRTSRRWALAVCRRTQAHQRSLRRENKTRSDETAPSEVKTDDIRKQAGALYQEIAERAFAANLLHETETTSQFIKDLNRLIERPSPTTTAGARRSKASRPPTRSLNPNRTRTKRRTRARRRTPTTPRTRTRALSRIPTTRRTRAKMIRRTRTTVRRAAGKKNRTTDRLCNSAKLLSDRKKTR